MVYRPLQKIAMSITITMHAYHVKFDRLLGNKYEVEITWLFVIITPVGKQSIITKLVTNSISSLAYQLLNNWFMHQRAFIEI